MPPYVLLRVFAGDNETVARYAAVLGIVGVIDIPLLYISIRLWRGIHPKVEQMAPEMAWTLLVCTGAFVCVFTWLLRLRLRSLHLARRDQSPASTPSGGLIAKGKTMPYLFAAFSVVWVVIFLYTLSISRRQRELSREVEALRRMTEERRDTESA